MTRSRLRTVDTVTNCVCILPGFVRKNMFSTLKKFFFYLTVEEKLKTKNSAVEDQCPIWTEVQTKRRIYQSPSDTNVSEIKSDYVNKIVLCIDGDRSWTRDGMSGLKQFTLNHENNFTSVQLLGKTTLLLIRVHVCRQCSKTQWKIEEKSLDCFKSDRHFRNVYTRSLPIRSRYEKEGSNNKGVFLELVIYTKKFVLNGHMKEA